MVLSSFFQIREITKLYILLGYFLLTPITIFYLLTIHVNKFKKNLSWHLLAVMPLKRFFQRLNFLLKIILTTIKPVNTALARKTLLKWDQS